MKSFLLLGIVLLISAFCFSQRYLTPVFDQVDVTTEIMYGSATDYMGANQDLILDFYEPQGDVETERPLIIYIHGGGFNSGTRELVSIQMICEDLAQRGYAVANMDYRLDPTFDIYNSEMDRRAMIDAMHDARAAVRYFRANAELYKIDSDQITIGGESAGAATSMLVNYVDEQSELEQTYPMANPNNIEGASGNPGFDSKAQFTLCLCGIMLDVSSIQSADAPLFWVHGTEDSFVPFALANLIPERAETIGLEHTKIVQEGADHCPWYWMSNPQWETYLDSTVTQISEFLYPKLDLGIANLNNVKEWQVSPNPAMESVRLLGIKPGDEVKLADVKGRIIWKVRAQDNDPIIDISQLPSGVYLITAQQRGTRKLVVD